MQKNRIREDFDMVNPNDEELKLNQKLTVGVGMVDSANLITMFVFYLKDAWLVLLQETARFILFPVSASITMVQMILAWRKAKLENSSDAWVHAGVEIVVGLGLITAMVGSLIAAPIFAAVAPFIFTVLLALKTLYTIGKAFYYSYKAYEAGQQAESASEVDKPTWIERQKDYQTKAYQHGITAFALVLLTIAVPFVMILLKPIVPILGVIAGALGFIYGAYQLYMGCTSTDSSSPAPAPAKQAEDKKDAFAEPKPAPSPKPERRKSLVDPDKQQTGSQEVIKKQNIGSARTVHEVSIYAHKEDAAKKDDFPEAPVIAIGSNYGTDKSGLIAK